MSGTILAAQVGLGIYAVLMAVGGVIGFLKAGSRPSLIAGLTSGAIGGLALAAAVSEYSSGYWLGLVLAIFLLGVFGNRLRKTGKFMPSGMLIVLSVIVVVLMGMALARIG